jgi:rhomboid protease GluP
VVFALQMLAALQRGVSPFDLIMGGGPRAVVTRFGLLLVDRFTSPFEPWRLLSAVFVHIGVVHVALNMLALSSFGRMSEPAVGPARFVLCYVVTGVVGFATTVAWAALTGGPAPATAGASGAVFGVMGMILGLLLRLRDPRWKDFAIQAVLYSVLFGFAVNRVSTSIAVNNSAHLGGLASGVVFGVLYAGTVKARALARAGSDLAVNLGAGAAVLACVASLLLAQVSPVWRAMEARSRGTVPSVDPRVEIAPEPPPDGRR